MSTINCCETSVTAIMQSFVIQFLQGNDGLELLSAIHAIWDSDWEEARRRLHSRSVLRNASFADGSPGATGGSNILSSKLNRYIRDHVL